MASYRHLARTCVMQTIHVLEFHGGDAEKILSSILDEFAPKLSERKFAYDLMEGVLEHKDEIIKTIQSFAPAWPIEKIAKVDRAILEMGTYEILFREDIPQVVAINEAIEIAKHYGDYNSPKFINGVLSSVMNANKRKDPPKKELSKKENEKTK
jgi:transcription antitermination protein NusB